MSRTLPEATAIGSTPWKWRTTATTDANGFSLGMRVEK